MASGTKLAACTGLKVLCPVAESTQKRIHHASREHADLLVQRR